MRLHINHNEAENLWEYEDKATNFPIASSKQFSLAAVVSYGQLSRASPHGDELTYMWKRTPSRSRKMGPPSPALPLTGAKMDCSPQSAGLLQRGNTSTMVKVTCDDTNYTQVTHN